MNLLHLSAILYNDWDPIEVKGLAPDDEYRSYAEEIIRIFDDGGGREEVLELLDRVRVDEMMLASDRREDVRVMGLIEDYRQSIAPHPSQPG